MIRYDRAPSPQLSAMLTPTGLLAPLLKPRVVAGLPVEVHLREGDVAQVYCGGTSLLRAVRMGSGARLSAAATYVDQPCAQLLFRTWSAQETGLEEALGGYLGGVSIGPKWVRGEGALQASWAGVRDPWTAFDREAVFGYDSTAERSAARVFPRVAAARAVVGQAGAWAQLPETKVGAELDQLAVDSTGRLTLIELKDASASADSVYYSPLQLLQYVWEWHGAQAAVRAGLDRLIAARVALGLAPALPSLSGLLRPVIAFGRDTRSAEVRARFDTVLAIVNRHLPPGVQPIEVWALSGKKPVQR